MTESEYLVLAEAVLNDIEIRLEHIADSSDVDIECYINGKRSDHEGYVLTNQYGTHKIVDREVFSQQNFTLEKSW